MKKKKLSDIAKQLTAAQLRELAAQKQEEEDTKIHKEGFLKEALYQLEADREWTYVLPTPLRDFWLLTPDQVTQAIQDFKNSWKLVLAKGTRFVAYKNNDSYSWFDDAGGYVEEMDDNWANEYLENIKEL